MADIRLTVDRRPSVAAAGTTAGAVLAAAGVEGAVAVRANEETVRDLAWLPGDGDRLESVPLASDEGRAILRHSTAHVMAQAVTDLFPDAKFAIGPPIDNGFYYDFDVTRPFTPEDVDRVEARMREIIGTDQAFTRRVVEPAEAQQMFAAQPYKLEIIDRAAAGAVEGEETLDAAGPGEITVYDNHPHGAHGHVTFTDLCRGPHVPSTKAIPAFKLMRTAAAYWRGDERNPMLQRIYGTAWESEAALAAHLELLRQAEERDHRKLGNELDLFSFPSEIGGGLAVWHPKGGAVRRAMEDYSRTVHEQAGYEFVVTPHLAKSTLFEISGHLGWYAEGMYPPMEMEGATYYPKPMNCPFHILIYKSRGRSYRDLPLRLFEFGTVYRFERSGVLHGLTRARGFTQDDSHIFCTPDQLAGELTSLLAFMLALLRDFGLTEFEAELATRPEKFVGEPEQWAEAEAALKVAVEASGVSYVVADGEGAFYAPKIDLHIRDAIGRRWQLSTLQVDLQMPGRFDMEYQTAENTRVRPYMIHRALFGSEERFFAILLEHYAGALPAWLSPVQVTCIPIAERHVGYLSDVAARLRAAGVRVEVDDSAERMQKKIVKAQQGKVPFMFIAGDRDIEAGAVSFRYRSGEERRGVPLDEAVAEVVDQVTSRRS
ncbi:MAG: threonine--tRNA ligase [Actinomycetota bacterium]|nr:threonine--tRNA ligase [Actinomycetota bacterium]